MHNYKELNVWLESIKLTTEIYKKVKNFPEKEKYGLISQLTRSAVSVSSNIAEGAGRDSKKDFYRFLSFAHGSAYELETQIIISKEIGFIKDDEFKSLNEKIMTIQKMIYNLKKSLNIKRS